MTPKLVFPESLETGREMAEYVYVCVYVFERDRDRETERDLK